MRRLVPSGTLALALLFALTIVLPACGDDGGDRIDAASGATIDAGPGAADARAIDASGLGPGQFCNTLPDGGPACQPDLVCCDETLTCRFPDDCASSGSYLPCDTTADCPSSKVCCQTDQMRFCTKRSACDSYGGEEIP